MTPENNYICILQKLMRKRMLLAERRQNRKQEQEIAAFVQEAEDCRQELDTFAKQADCFLPFEYLWECFQCNELERHVISLLAVFPLCPEGGELAGKIHKNKELSYVTPYMACLTFPQQISEYEMYQAFCLESLLGSIFLKDSGAKTMFSPLELKPRLSLFLLNGTLRYKPWSSFLHLSYPFEPLEELIGRSKLLNQLLKLQEKQKDQALLLRVWGEKGSGRSFFLHHLARRLKRPCIFLNLKAVEWEGRTSREQMENFCLESRLQGAIPVLWGEKREFWHHYSEYMRTLWERLCEEFDMVWSVAEEEMFPGEALLEAQILRVEMSPMTLIEAKDMWEKKAEQFKVDSQVRPGEMGNKYRLTPGKIAMVFQEARGIGLLKGEELITREMLDLGCRRILKQELNQKAVRIEPAYDWEQLILPEEQKEELKRACDQITYRHQVYGIWGMEANMAYGKGVSMIFSGAPGTGKTMAAQVLAKEIGLELYKVELAAVVSKYIGETEKNLEEIFEQAKRGQFILFFDEADALFGKRTEIRDSNDKYSNMEAAFMLQKIEEYEGITILATNYLQNFDEAFKRRIKFKVDFPLPDEGARKHIWEISVPPSMPIEEVDWDYISHFELSGSNIKNAVVYGAFLAASQKKRLGMRELLLGIKNEFIKSGKTLTKEDFGEYYLLLDAGKK